MLVLTRKQDQGICIGDVEVVVLDVQGGRVKLGVKAPDDIEIHRTEKPREIHQPAEPSAV